MNRTAALLLALTTLLAHCLLIHQDSGGTLAPPYEYAHAAFRQARNAVFYGDFAWNVGSTLAESYPSPLWVFLCAIAERLHVSVAVFAQMLGVFFVLAAVVVTAQFSRDRLAGVIAPLLLVVNGGLASAGAGGTEIGLLTFLIALAFLAQEERRPGWLAGSTVLLCFTRPEGVLVTLVLFAFELRRLRREPSRRMVRAFLWPAAFVAVLAISRWVMLGSPLSPYLFGWLAHGQPELGGPYLLSFFVVMGTPLLTVFPIYQLIRGKLVGRARRALALALFWILLVGWRGGDSLPYWNAVVPALPMLFLAIQDALTLTVDTERRLRIGFVWAVLLLTSAVSVFASKLPGKFGPVPGLPIPDVWWPQDEALADAYARTPGRLGLAHEINETERLRCIGIFIRDHLSARASILTPWPGAIGYLSRREVFDLRGRTTTLPGVGARPWYGTPKGDVIGSFKRRPDYVLAWIDDPEVEMPPTADLMRDWLERYDRIGPTPEREAELARQIAEYELIVVPVPARSSEPDHWSEWPVYFYRRRDLGLTPKLRVQVEGRSFAVHVKHRGHRQRIDLDVTVRDAERAVWSMRPTGAFELDAPDVRARKQILLYPTGTRWLQLMSGEIPEHIDPIQLTTILRNPGITDAADSAASNEPSTRFD